MRSRGGHELFPKTGENCNNMLTGEDRTKWKYADGVKILKEKD